MVGGTVGTVVESKHRRYRPGDVVVGDWGWQEYALSDGKQVQRFDTSLAPISTVLGVLGMPGLTAYFGLLDIGQPKPGETVFVSGGLVWSVRWLGRSPRSRAATWSVRPGPKPRLTTS